MEKTDNWMPLPPNGTVAVKMLSKDLSTHSCVRADHGQCQLDVGFCELTLNAGHCVPIHVKVVARKRRTAF